MRPPSESEERSDQKRSTRSKQSSAHSPSRAIGFAALGISRYCVLLRLAHHRVWKWARGPNERRFSRHFRRSGAPSGFLEPTQNPTKGIQRLYLSRRSSAPRPPVGNLCPPSRPGSARGARDQVESHCREMVCIKMVDQISICEVSNSIDSWEKSGGRPGGSKPQLGAAGPS